MKKKLAVLFFALAALFLFACAAEETPESTAQLEEKKDYSAYAGIVADPKTWYEDFINMPIANDDMTEDELRQLCADAFKANLSFQWTPTEDIAFGFTIVNKSKSVLMPKGIAYSGLFYNNNTAQGHLWKVLDFYDPETGALDIEAMGGNKMNILGSACARGALWGWTRVCNNSLLDGMGTFHQYAANILPVGPYNYPAGKYALSPGDGTKQMIADNGEQTMYESYALMKTADGLYSSSAYHVMMCAKPGEVVRLSDGTIDPTKSYIYVHEQATLGTVSEEFNYTQSNGVTMRPLGTVDKKVTFQVLLDKGYVPFALKELMKMDPIEPGEAWLEKGNKRPENGQDITVQEMLTHYLMTNYALCTFEFQVKDPDGQVLFTYNPRFMTSPTTYKTQLSSISLVEQVEPYANGKNTIHIYTRLSNGELLEAFNTLLKIA